MQSIQQSIEYIDGFKSESKEMYVTIKLMDDMYVSYHSKGSSNARIIGTSDLELQDSKDLIFCENIFQFENGDLMCFVQDKKQVHHFRIWNIKSGECYPYI